MKFDIEDNDSIEDVIDKFNSALEHIGYEVRTTDYYKAVRCEIYKKV